MSFITDTDGLVFAPGCFLATEVGVERKTGEIAQDHANVQTTEDGRKYVPMGAIYPSNDSSAEGIIYEDVDVTSGNMPGSVVTKGTVYSDRLFEELDSEAQSALEALGFTFVDTAPEVTRPY